MVKNPPAKQETQVRSLVQEDPLEKKIATYPSIVAWENAWTEKPGGRWSVGSQKVKHNLAAKQQQSKHFDWYRGDAQHIFIEIINALRRVVFAEMDRMCY